MNLSESLLQQIIQLAQQAGEHLLRFYNTTLTVTKKPDNTVVTQADLFVSQFLTEKLTSAYNIPVLSEENCAIPLSQRAKWQQYWLIDPLDGTQQFINGTDQFSVLISLIQNNRPVLGVIYVPTSKTTFYAMQGFGAYKQHSQLITPLKPRLINPDRPLKIALGANSAKEKVLSVLSKAFNYEFIMYGSSGLKSVLVAEGLADCYIRMGKTGEWDTAASEVLLAEIGGKVCDFQYQPLTYNQRDHFINPPFLMLASTNFNWGKTFQFN